MKRKAPEGGYDFGNKRQYRRDIYSQIDGYFNGCFFDKKILMMPSGEGDEIEVAMSKGFRQNNIFICDENPGIVANLKKRFPLVKTYGVSLDRAIIRIAKEKIKLDILNADLTGPINKKLYFTLKTIAESKVMDRSSMIFVTVLKGRELKGDLIKGTHMEFISVNQKNPDGLPSIHDNNSFRIHQIMWASIGLVDENGEVGKGDIYHAPYFGTIRAFKEYKSSCGQVMLWVAIMLHEQPCGCDTCFTAWKFLNVQRGINLGNDDERKLNLFNTVLWLNYGKEKFDKMLNEKVPLSIDRTKLMNGINLILTELKVEKSKWN